jgi:hypothetical protein
MKNSQKGFAVPIIITIVALLALGGGYVYYQSNNVKTIPESTMPDIVNNVPTSTNIVGGDKDVHGCIGSAGYTWCEVKNKCLRVWEEECEKTPINSGPGDKDGLVACTMDAKQCPDGSWVGRSGPKCEFVCPTPTDTDAPPPLGNSTLRISCGLEEIPGCTDPTKNTCSYMTKCNTEGVNSTRSDFYLIVDGTRVKILVDIETRLRFTMGPNETLKKWADFYPMIQSGPFGGGMPFGATIYGDWINSTTFKANWIKWTVG